MWSEPKTNWNKEDCISCDDYNRIKRNLIYLKDLANTLYTAFSLAEMGEDKTEEDYPYADEFNLLEENLKVIAENTWKADYGEKKVFHENGAFISYDELNRIEGAMLDLYNKLKSQNEGRRMLIFMLGKKEVF